MAVVRGDRYAHCAVVLRLSGPEYLKLLSDRLFSRYCFYDLSAKMQDQSGCEHPTESSHGKSTDHFRIAYVSATCSD